METIDVRGLACPTPLILTKRALLAATENTDFEIICNNEISLQNLKNYLRELGISYKEIEDEKKEFHLFFSGIEGSDWIESQETECMENDLSCKTEKEIENTKSKIGFYVVVIKSLQMGSGDPKLGDVLLKAYLNALPEI
ncbi:MAG: sulfurtransferase TusA family protein, partial [Bacteroidales bacterium]